MPRLPVYTGQIQPSAQSAGRVNPASFAQSSLQIAGQAIGSFGDHIEKIEDTWKKAEVSTNYNVSRNTRKANINRLLFEAQNDQDSSGDARKKYLNSLDKIYKERGTMGDDRVQRLYDSESQLEISGARIKLDQFYRNKMVKKNREQIVIDAQDSKNDYINTEWDDPSSRSRLKEGLKDRLDSSFASMFISELEYRDSVKGMDEWEYSRAIEDVSKDPQLLLQNIYKYDLTAKEKKKVINTAKIEVLKNNQMAIFNKQVERTIAYQRVWDMMDEGELTQKQIDSIGDEEARGLVQKRYDALYPEGAKIRKLGEVEAVSKATAAKKKTEDMAKRKVKQEAYMGLEAQFNSLIDDKGVVFKESNTMDILMGFQKSVMESELSGDITSAQRKFFLGPIMPALNSLVKSIDTKPDLSGGILSIFFQTREKFLNGGTPEELSRIKTNKAIKDIAQKMHPENLFMMNNYRINLHGLVFTATQEAEAKVARELTLPEIEVIHQRVINDFVINGNELGKGMIIGKIYTFGSTSYQMIGRDDTGKAQMKRTIGLERIE